MGEDVSNDETPPVITCSGGIKIVLGAVPQPVPTESDEVKNDVG